MEISGNDSSTSNASSSKSSKRARKAQIRNRKKRESKILPDLSATHESNDVEFSREMAENLEEEKCDLIMKVVSVIGREASMNLYKITQKIEREGGMLTMMKNRRRTPGGIFLFLLKTSDKIDEDLKKEVFNNDKKPVDKGFAERKMSGEQLSKDPPNSPTNPEFENGKLTDPKDLEQKILNFTKPDEDILELNYNDDMDTF
jgi:PHAX RNA-binding domain